MHHAEPLEALNVLITKALDKVNKYIRKRKAFSSPEQCPWEQKAFLIYGLRSR